MYHQYFGLNEAPFSIAVNPRYLFMSQRHRDALAHLLYGVSGGGGFILLTGEVGTGKTTVNRCLLEQLPETTDLAIILNPALSAVELLATACDELKIDYPSGTDSLKALTDALHRYLLENHERGRKTVLMIDEAQHLDFDVLEQIRLLTNLETNDEKLLQIILIGQPELTEKLSRPELRQLNQRITARYNLQPLNLQETTAYVRHRLEVAGLRGGASLFEAPALRKVHVLTRGIPRLINVLCDRALLGAYGQQRARVNKKLIELAAAEVFGEHNTPQSNARSITPRSFFAFGLVIVSIAIVLVFVKPGLYADLLCRGQSEAPALTQTTNAQTTNTQTTSDPLSEGSATEMQNSGNGRVAEPQGSVRTRLRTAAPAWELRPREASEVLWQVASNAPVPTSVCPPPAISGLRCTDTDMRVWDEVIALNRPVILEVVTQDKFAGATVLIAFRGESGLAWTSAGVVEVPLGDIAERWTGGVRYLWQAPTGWRDSIGQGDASPVVDRVAQMFATLDGMSVPTITTFLPELEARVRLFQTAEGLEADGVVGEQTLLRLNDRLGIGLTSQRALDRLASWQSLRSPAPTEDMRGAP